MNFFKAGLPTGIEVKLGDVFVRFFITKKKKHRININPEGIQVFIGEMIL